MSEVRVRRDQLEVLLRQLEGIAASVRALLEGAEEAPAEEVDEPEPQPAGGAVVFLEPRREFILSRPSEQQLADLSEIGHLEYADDQDNYAFLVREQDLWRVADWSRVEEVIRRYVPGHPHFHQWARQAWDRRNVFRIEDAPGGSYLVLRARSEEELAAVLRRETVRRHILRPNQRIDGQPMVRIIAGGQHRHGLKRALLALGYPVQDLAALEVGDPIRIALRPEVTADPRWEAYQREWVEQAYRLGAAVLVAPPGAGKTVTALGLICRCQTSTLILTPQRELAEQWRREIAAKTTWPAHQIGMYHGGEKRVAPVTVATYQVAGDRNHRRIFDRPWGLIIFDECHHLPADYFRQAAGFQSVRRLGLTASPVREDARERDIWALIGPPIGNDWARLFAGGFVARPEVELRKVPFPSDHYWQLYRRAGGVEAALIAAENPAKLAEARRILERNPRARALLFVEWVEHGQEVARQLGLPFVYGETPHRERERVYEEFRAGRLRALVVSRVGNQGLDLPDADLAIMLSWHGGSRQEGTQRTGRVMRPKESARAIYLVTKGTAEEDFARRQVQLLREQGVRVREVG